MKLLDLSIQCGKAGPAKPAALKWTHTLNSHYISQTSLSSSKPVTEPSSQDSTGKFGFVDKTNFFSDDQRFPATSICNNINAGHAGFLCFTLVSALTARPSTERVHSLPGNKQTEITIILLMSLLYIQIGLSCSTECTFNIRSTLILYHPNLCGQS